jgi:hypothetical protein
VSFSDSPLHGPPAATQVSFFGLSTALAAGEVCDRFCEGGPERGAAVDRRGDCAEGLSCQPNQQPGVAYFDNCNTPDTCKGEAEVGCGRFAALHRRSANPNQIH